MPPRPATRVWRPSWAMQAIGNQELAGRADDGRGLRAPNALGQQVVGLEDVLAPQMGSSLISKRPSSMTSMTGLRAAPV